MRLTHRHADGGLYSYIGPQEAKDPTSDAWVAGIAYQNDQGKMFWTDNIRWVERFTSLEQPVNIGSLEAFEDEEEITSYNFTLDQAEDVVHLFITVASVAARQRNTHLETVMRTQAEIITKGLHLREMEYVPDILGDIVAFHQKFGLEYNGKPRSLHTEKNEGEDLTLFDFRRNFIQEELDEYSEVQEKLTEKVEKYDEGGVVKYLDLQLDALCDMMYVVGGAAYLQFGRTIFYEAWRRVHEANMKKVRAERPEDSKRGSGFDVVKPTGWVPPSHVDLVQDHAHVIYRKPGSLNEGYAADTRVLADNSGNTIDVGYKGDGLTN